MDELSNSDVCLAFPKRPYFHRNVVVKDEICNVFKQFRALRFADETIYLRSGSLNLVNGFIGLNFSCDGTHYLTYKEFLGRGLDFWFGVSAEDSKNTCEIQDPKSAGVKNLEGINMSKVDELVETIAQRGCIEVNQLLLRLESGKIPEDLKNLSDAERLYVLDELKSVMAIYEGGVCSI
jgi:hypothetical protein